MTSVAVTADRYLADVEQHPVTIRRSPPEQVPPLEPLPVGVRVFVTKPADHPARRARSRMSTSTHRDGRLGPAPQHRGEPVAQDRERLVRRSFRHRPRLGLDRGERLLEGVGVDEGLVGASLPVRLDAEPEKVEPLVDVADPCLPAASSPRSVTLRVHPAPSPLPTGGRGRASTALADLSRDVSEKHQIFRVPFGSSNRGCLDAPKNRAQSTGRCAPQRASPNATNSCPPTPAYGRTARRRQAAIRGRIGPQERVDRDVRA